MPTKRRNYVFAIDMIEALQKEAKKQNRAESTIVRTVLKEYLEKRGHKIKMEVEHGGERPYGKDE